MLDLFFSYYLIYSYYIRIGRKIKTIKNPPKADSFKIFMVLKI